MLDTSGILLERLILTRQKHIDQSGGLSDNQYGFQKGRSTEDAMDTVMKIADFAASGGTQDRDHYVLVTLDVSNAFNSAPWSLIDAALREKTVPSYLLKILRSYMQYR